MRLGTGLRAVAVASLALFVIAACGGGTGSPQRLAGGKAVFAEAPNAKPNYIFPLASGGFFSVANLSQFQFLTYRPLYWFGSNGTVKLNSSLSLAQDPEAPFNTVITDAFGGSTAADMDNWGGGWIFAPDYYPTGDEIFSTGAGSNGGAYSDPKNDANTVASTSSNDIKALNTYEDYLAQQLPVIWIPVADSALSLVKKTMHGWDPQDPLL
ncbi:MAG: hypothetical protein E6I50_09110, partial [Chloroflexi bacterium]